MWQNFSKPRSAPKPDSVTTTSAVFSAIRSAISELLACAMFAKGPACTNAGWPSRVWTRFGIRASLSRTVIAPAAWRSSAEIRRPSRAMATTMRPSLARRSWMSLASASTAITSDAAVITKLDSRGMPWGAPRRGRCSS